MEHASDLENVRDSLHPKDWLYCLYRIRKPCSSAVGPFPCWGLQEDTFKSILPGRNRA